MDTQMASGNFSESSRRDSVQADRPPEVRAAERGLWFWLAMVLGANIAGLIWLAVRAESPQSVRNVLDIMLYGASGAAVAYFAFRALLRFPYHFFDLLVMVTVLSLGMKATVDFVQGLAAMGIVSSDLSNSERFGEVFQLCIWSGSVLVAGAAIGLRNCTLLKIERTLPRTICLISGMLFLPAAAGVTVFPVMLIRELFVRQPNSTRMLLLLAETIGAFIATAINSRCFMRTLTLHAEVAAQEKLPK